MAGENTKEIVESLNGLKSEPAVPKNIKIKIETIIGLLNSSNEEFSLKVDQARNIIDEISNDTNLQPYIRTQIWNIVSMLEKV